MNCFPWYNFYYFYKVQSCEDVGETAVNHFVDVNKMVGLGSGSKREIKDIALTRYACYLVAQNGDRKISKEHIDNNMAVRKMLLERGVKPEELSAAEDIKKIERRLASDEKKVLKEAQKEQKKKK